MVKGHSFSKILQNKVFFYKTTWTCVIVVLVLHIGFVLLETYLQKGFNILFWRFCVICHLKYRDRNYKNNVLNVFVTRKLTCLNTCSNDMYGDNKFKALCPEKWMYKIALKMTKIWELRKSRARHWWFYLVQMFVTIKSLSFDVWINVVCGTDGDAKR